MGYKDSMQTVRPSQNQLFCKPLDAETKTASGFLLPEKAAAKPEMAEVVNAGINVTQFKQHDIVIYKSYATTSIKLDGKEYFLVAEDDVLGVVVETE